MLCGIISCCINLKVIDSCHPMEGKWYNYIAYYALNAMLWFISVPFAFFGIIFWVIEEYSFIHNRINRLRNDLNKLEDKIKNKNI